MTKELIKCSQINVDCVANDPVDIKAGGPEYLGFDFYVKEEETENMKKFISLTLESLNIPLVNIYVSKTIEISEEKVWTKERIVECIAKEENYLLHEASRNYRSPRR